MRITENFKNRLQVAKQKGFEVVTVSKCSNYGVQAIVEIPIDELLQQTIGTNYNTGSRGFFPTKRNPANPKGIAYQSLFGSKFERVNLNA